MEETTMTLFTKKEKIILNSELITVVIANPFARRAN
jgi:hypothetical protein